MNKNVLGVILTITLFFIFAVSVFAFQTTFDSQKTGYLCGFAGSIIGGLISGSITFFAMVALDNENKKRWKKEAFYKYYVELTIQYREKLIFLSDLLEKLSYSEFQNFYSKEYLQDIDFIINNFKEVLETINIHLKRRFEENKSGVNNSQLALFEIPDYKICIFEKINNSKSILKKIPDYKKFILNKTILNELLDDEFINLSDKYKVFYIKSAKKEYYNNLIKSFKELKKNKSKIDDLEKILNAVSGNVFITHHPDYPFPEANSNIESLTEHLNIVVKNLEEIKNNTDIYKTIYFSLQNIKQDSIILQNDLNKNFKV